jgi:hypothetical protein
MVVLAIDVEAALYAFVGESISIGAGVQGEIHPTSLLEGGERQLEREIVQVDDHKTNNKRGMERYAPKVNRAWANGLE